MMALVAEIQDAVAADAELLKAVVVRECEDFPSAKTFLQSRPAGVYTCARAKASEDVSTKKLVEWSFHLQRLSTGLAMVDTSFDKENVKLDRLKMATESLTATVLTKWTSMETVVDGMLSVLWYPMPDAAAYGVAVHICPMPQPKCLASTVLVYGEGREKAKCKHTQWIQNRVPIEKHVAQLVETRGEPIHEVLLSKRGPNGDRLLLEGLITNFFVVKDGALFTAGEGVLEGSTRELVLKACRDLAIPVALEAPKLSERGSWQAAFVTSAVRVVIDVTRLLCEEEEGGRKVLRETSIPSDSSWFTRRIRDQILAKHMYLD
ncbi:uncharacterized protein KRP23_13873 [Phytophthora ramorum]|nr:hypothetical protein KRP23_13873 [Phytophthora ramorum]